MTTTKQWIEQMEAYAKAEQEALDRIEARLSGRKEE